MNKRKKKNYCLVCGNYCRNSKSGLYRRHWKEKQVNDYEKSMKIEDFSHTASRHKYQNVREHAHRVAILFMKDKTCESCGYKVYVELCHKRAITDFPKHTRLMQVNSLDNLVWLCPNHHKELELGLI